MFMVAAPSVRAAVLVRASVPGAAGAVRLPLESNVSVSVPDGAALPRRSAGHILTGDAHVVRSTRWLPVLVNVTVSVCVSPSESTT